LIPRFTTTARRRSPPSSAARRRSGACVHPQPLDPDLATLINPPPLLKSASSAAVGSRSNGSDRANQGQYRSNRQAFAFLQKTPWACRILQKNPPTVVDCLQLGPFVVFRPIFFRVLYSLVLALSTKRILVVLALFSAFFMSTRLSRSVEQFYALFCFVSTIWWLFLIYSCCLLVCDDCGA
jgi:hypothetical protein